MILGCGCHCVEESSESHSDSTPSDSDPSDNPPSESVSDNPPSESRSDGPPSDGPPSDSEQSDSEPSIDVMDGPCAFGTCIGGVIPARYKVTYNFGNSLFCGPDYQGVFTLPFSGGTGGLGQTGVCGWRTAEKARYQAFQAPEFVRQCYTSLAFDITQWRFTLALYQRYFPGLGSGKRVELRVHTNLNVMIYESDFTLPTAFNCVSSFTLPLASSTSTAQKLAFARMISGITATDADVPTSVLVSLG